MQQTNDHHLQNVDIAKTSSIFESDCSSSFVPNVILSYSTNFENSLSIDLTFVKFDEKVYSTLNKKCVLNDLILHKKIKIPNVGTINEINLLNFPLGQYILSVQGTNIATAKYNNKNYTFDIANSNSEMLSLFKSVAICNDEPIMANRNEYLNLSRIDTINITVPKSINLDKKCLIEMKGYFKKDNNWNHESNIFSIYPYDTYSLNLNKITESIDIMADNDGEIIFIIDTVKYNIPVGPIMTKISFRNNETKYIGIQNTYLPNLNEHTINFSRIDSVSIIVLNCKITKLYQNYYETYSYPERNQLFV